jgi:hypothetical protein
MGQNAAKKTIELEDCLFDEETILNNVENREHIFQLNHLENQLGYISLYDLKELIAVNAIDFTDYTIKQIDAISMSPLYEHPYFQRRKPQLISTDNLISNDFDETYFLLLRGQKKGPYNHEQIKELISKKEILVTDLISSNAGHTWVKLYLMEGFDRRNLKDNDELPSLPSREFFSTETITENIPTEIQTTDAITGLAYLGNLKRGKAIEREREEHLEEAIKKSSKATFFYKFLFVVSMIGILYMANSLKNSLKSPFGESDNDTLKIGEQSDSGINELTGEPNNQAMKSLNDFNNSRMQNSFQPRKLNPVRLNNTGRSFSSTDKFKNAQNNQGGGSNEEEQSYYYNDTAPIELDPVRTQVSKETFEQPIGEPAPMPNNDPLFNQEIDN